MLHATTAAYPGLSARLQVHGDRGSAVIDNDQLAFFEVTAAGDSPEEKLMGTTSPTSRAVPTAGSDPGQLSDAHRLQYLNFLGALDGTEELRVDLETNRQSIGVITGAYESARTGRPVTAVMNRIAANPIPYWSTAGKTREVFEEAFRDFQEIGFTAVKADVPDGMTAPEYADWIAGYGLAPSLSLFNSPFDETVDMAAGGGEGPAVRRRPRRRWAWTVRWSPRCRCRPGWPNRRSAPASTRAGWPARSTTAAPSAGCCGPRACGRCTTRTSAGSSRPSTRSPGCSTTWART